MPRREEEPLANMHIRLFESDVEFLRQDPRIMEIGLNKAVRLIVRDYVKRVRERQGEVPTAKFKIEEIIENDSIE